MMTTVAAEYDHMELQQQYSSNDTVNNRWDDEWDNENSSARLFERSRIKALAGRSPAPLKYHVHVLMRFCLHTLCHMMQTT